MTSKGQITKSQKQDAGFNACTQFSNNGFQIFSSLTQRHQMLLRNFSHMNMAYCFNFNALRYDALFFASFFTCMKKGRYLELTKFVNKRYKVQILFCSSGHGPDISGTISCTKNVLQHYDIKENRNTHLLPYFHYFYS